MLLKPFNEIVVKFLEQIKPLADGKTEVLMKVHFGEMTLNVISKVYNFSQPLPTLYHHHDHACKVHVKARHYQRLRKMLNVGGGGG